MFCEKVKLDFECNDYPLRLLTSQWQRGEKCIIYVWYRWIVAIFFLFSFINSVVFSITKHEAAVMVIYLSRWNLFGTTIASLLGAYLVTYSHFQRNKITNRVQNVLKFYWFLCNNSVVFACVVSSIYWTLLYPGGQCSLNNYLVHATNSIVLVIDVFVIRHPHRMEHFIYPMTFGTIYMFFTFIYTVLGGVDRNGNNYVYPVLDWKNKPQQSVIVGVCCVALLGIFHAVIGVFHRMRNKIHQYIASKNEKCEQILPIVNDPDVTENFRMKNFIS